MLPSASAAKKTALCGISRSGDFVASAVATSAPSDALRSEGIALVRTCNAMLDGIEEQAALLA